jgi:hypothetical protein
VISWKYDLEVLLCRMSRLVMISQVGNQPEAKEVLTTYVYFWYPARYCPLYNAARFEKPIL